MSRPRPHQRSFCVETTLTPLPSRYAYFAPGIIATYGYSPIQTQLHSVPPWAAAFGYCMLTATLSDATRHRFGFAIFSICVAVTGFGIAMTVHDNTSLQYGALFLVTSGTYTAMPIIVCWFNMNLGWSIRLGWGHQHCLANTNDRRTSSSGRWQRVADRLRKHRRHHRSFCIRGA